MEALFQSWALVLASEMGDKTQLLALVLALRFKRPWTIMFGILVATLLNHALASVAGSWIASLVSEGVLRLVLAATFFAFALWILIPDKMDGVPPDKGEKVSAFWTTVVLFFMAEMGDKTQLATLALGAKFQMPLAVTVGTTLGMLVADGLAVFFGEKLTAMVPMKIIRIVSSLLFGLFGVGILIG